MKKTKGRTFLGFDIVLLNVLYEWKHFNKSVIVNG